MIAGSTKDVIQRYCYVFGIWEPNITHWTEAFLREGDLVLDVGANIGYFSLLASQAVGTTGTVVAVEPVPSIVTALKTNLAMNSAANVVVHAVAAGSQPPVDRNQVLHTADLA